MYSLSPSKEETYVEFKRGLMNLKAIKTNNQRRRELKLKTTPGLWYCRATDDDHCMNARYVGLSPSPNYLPDHEWEHDHRQGLAFGNEEQEDPDKVIAITLLQVPPLAMVEESDENMEFIVFAHNENVEDEVDWLLSKAEAKNSALEALKTLYADLEGYLIGAWTGNEGLESMRDLAGTAITALES